LVLISGSGRVLFISMLHPTYRTHQIVNYEIVSFLWKHYSICGEGFKLSVYKEKN
jgi:hypothetical protein